jgi:hypothetical protein
MVNGYIIFLSKTSAEQRLIKKKDANCVLLTPLQLWKNLTDEERTLYGDIARERNKMVLKGKNPKKVCGYCLYVKARQPVVKDLTLVGKEWSALPKSEQNEWNAKAKTFKLTN